MLIPEASIYGQTITFSSKKRMKRKKRIGWTSNLQLWPPPSLYAGPLPALPSGGGGRGAARILRLRTGGRGRQGQGHHGGA
jgi:hypothetical protein